MKDHLVFQLKQRKNQDQNGQYGGGFQTQGKSTMGKKNQNSKSKVLKNRQGGIKKRCQTKGRDPGGGFLPFDF